MTSENRITITTEGISENIYAVRYLKSKLEKACSCFSKIILQIADEPEQGYSISFRENTIYIKACGPAGFLYGSVELVKMLSVLETDIKDKSGETADAFSKETAESMFGRMTEKTSLRASENVPSGISEIRDCPKLARRGFYHDSTRGRVQTLESYKAMADRMVELKLNELQLYVEHTFRFSFLEEVWRDNTPLTAEDITELDAYCRERCIDLVPSLSTFGHFYTILRTKEYAHLCELPDMEKDRFSFAQRMQHHTLDVTNPESIQLVERMLKEFMPLFSSKYVNICADETFDLGKGRSKKYVESVGVAEAYVGFLKKIMKIVTDAGKTPMFWGDILASFPEYAKELPEGVICLNWGYSENEGEERTAAFAAQGLTQYLCPGVQGWNHSINRLDTAWKNISLMCGYALKYGAAGLLTTDWGDFGHYNDPAFSVPGMAYGAYLSWAGTGNYTEEGLDRKISAEIYGDSTGTLVGLMKELAKCEAASWGSFVAYKEKAEGISDVQWLLIEVNPETAEALNKKSLELCEKISVLSEKVNENGKTLIRRLLLFARGQRIINSLSAEVSTQMLSGGRSADNTPRNDGNAGGKCSNGGRADNTPRNDENDGGKRSNGRNADNTPRNDEYAGESCVDSGNTENALSREIKEYASEYRKNWLETSRESELFRIEEVFSYYFGASLKTP